MKKPTAIFLILSAMLLMSIFVQISQSQVGNTLAESLNNYLNSIDWSDTSASSVQFGIIFSKFSVSAYEGALHSYLESGDWIDVLLIKRLAELSGYDSQNLTLAVVQALENMPMVGYLPITDYGVFFCVNDRFLLNAYRWAKQVSGDINMDGTVDIYDAVLFAKAFGSVPNSTNWNVNCDFNGNGVINYSDSLTLAQQFGQSSLLLKWNETAAFQQLANLVDKCGGGFSYASVNSAYSGAIPMSNEVVKYAGFRYYDEEAQTLGCFLIFEEDGITEARSYEDKIWNLLNDYWWSGLWYWYRTDWEIFECEMGRFAMQITAYLGYVSPNIISDLYQKLLINGWNSSSWQPWLYVVNHANLPIGTVVAEEARPEETLTVWEALESFYSSFNTTMQNAITDMLTNEPKAWEAVLTQPCYNTDQLAGVMIMFLNGIVPETGSLRDNLTEESYVSNDMNFPASEYRFDYAGMMIRIPTTSGEIGFQFGSQIVSYNFTQGVWDIYFNNDWNSIENVVSVK